MVAHVQEPPQHRIGEEAERAQREDGRDGEGGVLVVRLDRALRRDDRRDAADRGSHRQQAGQLRLQLEGAPEHRHEPDGDRQLDGDQGQRDAAQLEDVPEQEARAEQHDARLEPNLVGRDAGAEHLGDTHRVRDDEPEEDGPKDVLDVGQREVVGGAVPPQDLLADLAGVPDDEQQRDSGQEPRKTREQPEGWGRLQRDRFSHGGLPSPRYVGDEPHLDEGGGRERGDHRPPIQRNPPRSIRHFVPPGT